jgi:hypothetical protein
LVLPVTLLHGLLASLWPQDRFGWGEGAAAPTRIEVAFVRELRPAPPPAPPAPAEAAIRVLRTPRLLRAPAAAASAAGEAAPVALDEALREPLPAAAATNLPELAPAPEIAAALLPRAAAAPSEAASAAAARFEWPPSTRLSYVLTGNYRGPVEGQARVEWRLAGARYQVALDLGIGPPFAPLVTRQLLSDGLVTAAGLEPRRYDEETRMVLREPRRLSIALDADHVQLPSGRQVPRPAGVQDSASQFVQLTWMFTLQPERLAAGQLLHLPLALPRRVETWTYEVVGPAQLATPVGALETVHVRPHGPTLQRARAGGELSAEFWVAPSLQYLPVRIVIRQDAETYVDLLLERLPQQAESPVR